ncbi:MAG: hypothetical protein ACI89X_002395 [Planctomycetota bacterium]|jgi:hypothetical protein
MKALICIGSLLLGAVVATPPLNNGIAWETSFDDAKERAKAEGKGIFHLQLFGRLNEQLC